MSIARSYEFAPGLRLRVQGKPAALRHFDAEYGPAAIPNGTNVEMELDVAESLAGCVNQKIVRGGHKTVRWEAALSSPDDTPLRLCIELSGVPISFALSLVQGFFVEPTLSIAAARNQLVLLPSAAIVEHDRAVLIVGRSRTGKSSVSARAAAAGRLVLGDDQVLVEATGDCRAFPRRLRFYSDLRRTAPLAYERLPPRVRTGLVFRRFLLSLTRGFAAPPVRVPVSLVGPDSPRASLPLDRVTIVRRSAGVRELDTSEITVEEAVAEAIKVLGEQRRWLEADAPSRRALAPVLEQERSILLSAFAGRPTLAISIPDAWDAPRAITGLAEAIGAERPRGDSGPRAR